MSVPESWDAVKRAVDADPRSARFLLTGSAPFGDTPTHSGAGRTAMVRMRPLTLVERGAQPSVSLRELLVGAHPAEVPGETATSLDDYVDALLDSGLPALRG